MSEVSSGDDGRAGGGGGVPDGTRPAEPPDDPNRGRRENAGPEPIPVGGGRPGGKSFLELFPQLFLIPALIVTVIIFIMVLFSASKEKSATELISEMKSGGKHARKQAAYALASRILRLSEAGEPQYFSSEETSALLGLMERFPREDLLHRYVLLALGRAGQPSQTLPVLESVAEDLDTPDGVRAAALEALGCTRDKEAVPVLLEQVRRLESPDKWEIRLRAIHALANLRASGTEFETQPVVDVLSRCVNDTRKEISWNTAYYLAAYFGSDAGIEVLRRLLDWDFLDRQRADRPRNPESREAPGLTAEEKQTWMRLALKAVYALEQEEALDVVAQKAKDRRSLKVRNTAHRILEEHAKRRTKQSSVNRDGAPLPDNEDMEDTTAGKAGESRSQDPRHRFVRTT